MKSQRGIVLKKITSINHKLIDMLGPELNSIFNISKCLVFQGDTKPES